MKKRNLALKTAGAALVIGLIATNALSGQPLKRLLTPKLARAGNDIVCDCSLTGSNKVCAANNYGSNCAPAGTTNCSSYNSNCEG